MARSKDKNEVEYLRSIVRQQRSQLKHLKKHVNRSNKRKQYVDDLEAAAQEHLLEIEREEEIIKKDICPNCGKDVSHIDLKIRKIYSCESCGWRRAIKK